MSSFVEPADIGEALAEYRRRLADHANDELIADFIVFCWQAVDPGRVATLDLSDELVDACADQLSELLKLATTTCGKWSAPLFWKRYIEWADLAEVLSIDECKLFMHRSAEYVEPAFFVFLASGGAEMRSEAMILLAQHSDATTTRSRYVRSVLESRRRTERAFR
jgi:hypothetical protein